MASPSRTRFSSAQMPGWTHWTRFNGRKYYSKPSEVVVSTKGRNTSHISTIVVDEWRLRSTANETVHTSAFCDEIYFAQTEKCLLIFHSSQTAFYSSQPLVSFKTQRKLYWQYIAAHSAHTARALKKWLPEAQNMAMVYLNWCALEALTSSEARPRIPFALKHSQQLTNILTSLSGSTPEPDSETTDAEPPSPPRQAIESPELEADVEVLAAGAPHAGSSSHPVTHPTGDDTNQFETEVAAAADLETAAHESRKLRTMLIAKVLSEKYSQQDAEETSNETSVLPMPSRGVDGLFWVVDVASLGSFLRYLNRLDEIRATILTDDQWSDHIVRLVKEWEEFNLISTVLLSASAGILALENITAVPRTAILISTLLSFGSITSGLYCISMYQLRAKNDQDARTNELTIFNYNQYTSTHKGIALILGLPMAFLVWSLVAFMVGILSYNIVGTHTSNGSVSHVAYAVIAVAAVVFLLIALAFYSLSRLWGAGGAKTMFTMIHNAYMNVFGQHWRRQKSESTSKRPDSGHDFEP